MAAQIGGYLSETEHRAFKQYAASLGVSESSLASLIVLRELHQQRMLELIPRFQGRVPAQERKRITAHQRDPEPKAAFDAWCNVAGIPPDQGATILFRAELDERWLLSCVGG